MEILKDVSSLKLKIKNTLDNYGYSKKEKKELNQLRLRLAKLLYLAIEEGFKLYREDIYYISTFGDIYIKNETLYYKDNIVDIELWKIAEDIKIYKEVI